MFSPSDILAVMVKARGNILECDQSFYTDGQTASSLSFFLETTRSLTGGQKTLFNMIGWYVTQWNRELTLKCKLKCYVQPVKNPLGAGPSKGSQGTTRSKEKKIDLGGNRTHDIRIRSTVTLPTVLRGRTEKAGHDFGGESQRRESKGTYECCAAQHL